MRLHSAFSFISNLTTRTGKFIPAKTICFFATFLCYIIDYLNVRLNRSLLLTPHLHQSHPEQSRFIAHLQSRKRHRMQPPIQQMFTPRIAPRETLHTARIQATQSFRALMRDFMTVVVTHIRELFPANLALNNSHAGVVFPGRFRWR